MDAHKLDPEMLELLSQLTTERLEVFNKLMTIPLEQLYLARAMCDKKNVALLRVMDLAIDCREEVANARR